MERRELVIKGWVLEASSQPFIRDSGFHYAAVTKPITIVDAQASAVRTLKQLTTPTCLKRPGKTLEEDAVSKKPKPTAQIESLEPLESAAQIRERLLSRFIIPACLVSQTEPIQVVAAPTLVQSPPPQQEVTSEKFLQLLDCLNNLQRFTRQQAEVLARHGIPRFLEEATKLTVWDKGYYRSSPQVTPPHSAVPSLPLRRLPKKQWGVKLDELLSTLGIHRPPCYSGNYRVVRQARAKSNYDAALEEYRLDKESLFYSTGECNKEA